MEETRKERDAIGRFIAEHQLADNVDIVGHVDVPRFLRSLDLFVYAVQTTLGMIDLPPTLIEALAAGCGVVTSRMGGIGELIEDHGNGLLVGDGDHGKPQAYAARILDLLRDRALLERVRRNGPPSVERFELGRVGRQVVEFYERALKPDKAGEG
jgi:glycosyltransferase involved in cell wall biosynthesis